MAVRDQYMQFMIEKIGGDKYPSPSMLNRVEGEIRTHEQAEGYLALLYTKVADSYPSPSLLDRIARVTTAIEAYEISRGQYQ